MKNFKTSLLILFTVNFIIFCSLLVWSIITNNKLTEDLDKLDSLSQQSEQLEGTILHSKIIEHDLAESISQHEQAISLIRDTVNFKEDLINEQENLISKYKNKSVSAINGEINRLLPSLRKRCESSEVAMVGLGQSAENSFTFEDNSENSNQYGFGFSAYDGFWPNFDKSEANLLGLQSAVIKEIIDFVATAANGSSLKLISIKREAVGKTDEKYIGNEKLESIKNKVFGNLDNVQSLVFEIQFQGKTNQARTFFNQLRPPYCLVKFSSLRKTKEKSNEQDDSFISFSKVDKKTDILPIIHDIDSQFTFLFEYIYEIDYSSQKLVQILEDHFKSNKLELEAVELLKSEIN